MQTKRRGAHAALFLSVVLGAALVGSFGALADTPELAPGETVSTSGLTTIVRRGTASGAAALELWVRCPSDGWTAAQPGIARLAAFAALSAKVNGASLRDLVRADGGQVSVSVFQTATEIAVLVPGYRAQEYQDQLFLRIFHASLDARSLDEAKTRLAEQQAAALQSSDALLREAVFPALFASGPLHDSTFGNAQSLKAATLDDVRSFAAQSYVPQRAIFVAVGNVDARALAARPESGGNSKAAPAMPPSTRGGAQVTISLPAIQADVPGVALAWVGPPISDKRAATAMDFLSDYLADSKTGILAQAAERARPGASFSGQFITLENPGVFYVSATGEGVDPSAAAKAMQAALAPVLADPLRSDAFAQALGAYESRLLRQMDSPQGLADNYGWYFAQDSPGYTPSATDADLGGAYFSNASSLTPGYVRDVARRYLGAPPVTVVVTPHPVQVHVSPGGN